MVGRVVVTATVVVGGLVVIVVVTVAVVAAAAVVGRVVAVVIALVGRVVVVELTGLAVRFAKRVTKAGLKESPPPPPRPAGRPPKIACFQAQRFCPFKPTHSYIMDLSRRVKCVCKFNVDDALHTQESWRSY